MTVGARCERCGAALDERESGVCAVCAAAGTTARPAVEVSPDELIADAQIPPAAEAPPHSVVTSPSGLLETGTGRMRTGADVSGQRPRAIALTAAVVVVAIAAILVFLLRGG